MQAAATLILFVTLHAFFVTLPASASEVIYQTDFSTDPGWATDQPDRCRWDPTTETYRIRAENEAPAHRPNRYFYTLIPALPGAFTLEWDIRVTRLDWSAGIDIGLFDENLRGSGTGGGQSVYLDVSRVDAGLVFGLYAFGSEGGRVAWEALGLAFDTWYRCRIAYDPAANAVSATVLERDTGKELWSASVEVAGSFTAPLDHLGGTRFGMCEVGEPCSGVNPRAVAEGEIDAVALRAPAPACGPGVTAFYPFEGDARDACGTAHGTLHGSAGFEEGRRGLALSLDGARGSYVQIPDPIADPTSWLIACSFLAREIRAGEKGEGGFLYANADSIQLGVRGDGRLWGRIIYDWGHGGAAGVEGPLIEVGRWYDVALRYDGGILEFRVDGGLVAEADAPRPPARADVHRIGNHWVNDNGFNGLIDSMRFLSPAPPAADRFALEIPDVRIPWCGARRIHVALTNPTPVDAFSFGIAYDPSALRIEEVSYAGCAVLASLHEGEGPAYWRTDVDPPRGACGDEVEAGVTVAALTDMTDPMDQVILPGEDRPIAALAVRGAGEPGATSALRFTDCLGDPPVETILSALGDPVEPETSPGGVTLQEASCFVRGDATGEGRANIVDAVRILRAVFGAAPPPGCWDALDANDDGSADVADAIYLLNYLFGPPPSPPPPEPFPAPGEDPTDDDLPPCGR